MKQVLFLSASVLGTFLDVVPCDVDLPLNQATCPANCASCETTLVTKTCTHDATTTKHCGFGTFISQCPANAHSSVSFTYPDTDLDTTGVFEMDLTNDCAGQQHGQSPGHCFTSLGSAADTYRIQAPLRDGYYKIEVLNVRNFNHGKGRLSIDGTNVGEFDSCKAKNYNIIENQNFDTLLGGSSESERCPYRYSTLQEATKACDADRRCSGVSRDFGLCGGKLFELRTGNLQPWDGIDSHLKNELESSWELVGFLPLKGGQMEVQFEATEASGCQGPHALAYRKIRFTPQARCHEEKCTITIQKSLNTGRCLACKKEFPIFRDGACKPITTTTATMATTTTTANDPTTAAATTTTTANDPISATTTTTMTTMTTTVNDPTTTSAATTTTTANNPTNAEISAEITAPSVSNVNFQQSEGSSPQIEQAPDILTIVLVIVACLLLAVIAMVHAFRKGFPAPNPEQNEPLTPLQKGRETTPTPPDYQSLSAIDIVKDVDTII